VGKISLIIIEDHDILRDSLVTTLMMKDFHVAGNFPNAGDALLFLAGNDVDIAVVDFSLPDMDGPVFTVRARELKKDQRILLLSMHKDMKRVKEALEAGVNSYVPKDAPISELVSALNRVYEGDDFISPTLTKKLINGYEARPGRGVSDGTALSPQHMDFLRLTGEGMSVDEIARRQSLSLDDVKSVFTEIFRILGARDRAHALCNAIDIGLFTEDGPPGS